MAHVERLKKIEKLSVARAIAETLQARGVDKVFCIPGGPISPLVDALLETHIAHVQCQEETMAVYMASGYAKATGRPAVVIVTSGPGILNAVTGIAAAYHDEIPLLIFAGEVATTSSGRGALQDGGPTGLDIGRMLAPITRGSHLLAHERRALPMLDQAFSTAMSMPRGPVLLRVPVDLLRREAGMLAVASSEPAALPQASVNQCRTIAELLHQAQRPVLLAGLGARNSNASQALIRLAEAAKCPVITDLEGKGAIPETHPLSLGVFGVGARGSAASFLAEGVDLLISVGARFDDTTTSNFSPLLQGQHTLVQLDYDAARLGRAYSPELAVVCDLPLALATITAELPDIDGPRLRNRKWNLSESAPNPLPPVPQTLGAAPHDPRAVAAALRSTFGPSALFSSDIGNHLLFMATEMVSSRPDSFHVSIGLGGMGSGLGTAIGLQLGVPNRQVVCVIGDGGMLMVGTELATAVALQLPLVVVVFNDRQLGMVRHGHQRLFNRSQTFETPNVDYCGLARSLGAEAERVASIEQLRATIARPRRGPVMLEFSIDGAIQPINPREATLNFDSAPAAKNLTVH
ncbi:MAG: thiamine pyrophosphate-binding protein [Archangium sp.]|nr:thiamine pyrophosphate-binding protein [Archangium sp.]